MYRWYYEYLPDEELHYLIEVHPEDGILGEHFFETTEEFLDYVDKHNIKFQGKVKIDAEQTLIEMLQTQLDIEIWNGITKTAKEMNEDFELPSIGHVGGGMYHLGGGCYTGLDGWKQFEKELIKQMKDENNWRIDED